MDKEMLEKLFDEKAVKDYPLEILEKRLSVEGNFISCLWKNPELYEEYKEVTTNDFMTNDGKLLFRLGSELSRMNYKVFDAITLNTYLKDKPRVSDAFKKINGYTATKEMIEMVNLENSEQYFEDFVKQNIIKSLYEQGFDVVKNWKKFEMLSAEDVYGYYEIVLNNVFLKKQNSVLTVDLTDGYTTFLEECDKGMNMGVSISSAMPILNNNFCGLHKRNVLLHTAHSGVGKSSSAIVMYILPLIQQGEKVCLLINEQTEKDWRSMIISSVMSNILRNCKVPRSKIQHGGFTAEDWVALNEAVDWLEQRKGQLMFVQMFDYSISNIRKVVKKHKQMGYGTFIIDTLKPEREDSDKSWGIFTENSKELFQLANKHNIIMICTAQLSGATIRTRYLTVDCLAKAKSIKEIAGQMTMIRNVWDDEKDGCTYDIKPYKYLKDEFGKYTQTKEYFTMDESKEYAILFVEKNRWGKDGFQILLCKNLNFNTWYEVGFCTVLKQF